MEKYVIGFIFGVVVGCVFEAMYNSSSSSAASQQPSTATTAVNSITSLLNGFGL